MVFESAALSSVGSANCNLIEYFGANYVKQLCSALCTGISHQGGVCWLLQRALSVASLA